MYWLKLMFIGFFFSTCCFHSPSVVVGMGSSRGWNIRALFSSGPREELGPRDWSWECPQATDRSGILRTDRVAVTGGSWGCVSVTDSGHHSCSEAQTLSSKALKQSRPVCATAHSWHLTHSWSKPSYTHCVSSLCTKRQISPKRFLLTEQPCRSNKVIHGPS